MGARPVLVGESNPYGEDPAFALYPRPRGASGDRLCRLVLGMTEAEYLWTFRRVNLCPSRWSAPAARARAAALIVEGAPLVLLGAKVCSAFGPSCPFVPFSRWAPTTAFGIQPRGVILPHPSGLSRAWNEPGAYVRGRELVRSALTAWAAAEARKALGIWE